VLGSRLGPLVWEVNGGSLGAANAAGAGTVRLKVLAADDTWHLAVEVGGACAGSPRSRVFELGLGRVIVAKRGVGVDRYAAFSIPGRLQPEIFF
jgi:hypothetical protein